MSDKYAVQSVNIQEGTKKRKQHAGTSISKIHQNKCYINTLFTLRGTHTRRDEFISTFQSALNVKCNTGHSVHTDRPCTRH